MTKFFDALTEIFWDMPLFVLYTFFIFSMSSLIYFFTTKNMLNSVVALMTVPSIIAIIYLTPKVKEEVVRFKRNKASKMNE